MLIAAYKQADRQAYARISEHQQLLPKLALNNLSRNASSPLPLLAAEMFAVLTLDYKSP